MELASCNGRHTKTREISSGRANIYRPRRILFWRFRDGEGEHDGGWCWRVAGLGKHKRNIQLMEENLNKKGNPNMGRGHNNIEGGRNR